MSRYQRSRPPSPITRTCGAAACDRLVRTSTSRGATRATRSGRAQAAGVAVEGHIDLFHFVNIVVPRCCTPEAPLLSHPSHTSRACCASSRPAIRPSPGGPLHHALSTTPPLRTRTRIIAASRHDTSAHDTDTDAPVAAKPPRSKSNRGRRRPSAPRHAPHSARHDCLSRYISYTSRGRGHARPKFGSAHTPPSLLLRSTT